MPSIRRNISLRELRAFCAAAEHESFREAADRLYVTASAVSHQIKSLEGELDTRLFARTSRSIFLTDEGRALYADVRPLIEQLDAVVANHSVAAERHELRISVQPFFANELLIPRLPEFTAMHPDIDIKLETNDESSEKHPDGVDVSIRIFRRPPANLQTDLLFPLRLIPAGAPSMRARFRIAGDRVTGEFPLIVHDTRPHAWPQWEKLAGIRLPRDPTLVRLDSMNAVARAAERGLGAALLPVQLSDSRFESGSLIRLSDSVLVTKDAYYVVSEPDEASDDSIRLFRSWVLQEFGDLS